jgi:methylated-DNA-protein-cysteine methyltransferase-like protein
MSIRKQKSNQSYLLIWRNVADIPFGRVATYGQIAELAGLTRQARLVGYALHNIPRGLDIPWHRVINAQGKISFPKDSEPYRRQLQRLAEENIELINGQIDLARYRWQPDLDELLWKPKN